MTAAYTLHTELNRELDLSVDGTMSRTLLQDERTKVLLFNSCAGQELSEHTASTPAIMHFLAGDADLTLGPTSSRPAPALGFTCRLNFLTAFAQRPASRCYSHC